MTKLPKLTASPLLAGAVTGGALAAALIHAPLASADPFSSDEEQFISDLHAAGIVDEAGSKNAIQNGWQVCSDLSSGVSRQQEAIQIAQGSASTPTNPGDTDLSLTKAERFVSIAMTDLCSQDFATRDSRLG